MRSGRYAMASTTLAFSACATGRRLAPYELNAFYRRALAAAGAPSGEWAYDRFDDGTPITGRARKLYRVAPELAARFPDPFVAGPEGYLAYLRANHADLL